MNSGHFAIFTKKWRPGRFSDFCQTFFQKMDSRHSNFGRSYRSEFLSYEAGKKRAEPQKLKFLFLRAIYTHFVKEKTQVKYKTFWGEKLRKCLTKLSLGPISLHFTKLVERWVRNHFAMGLRSLRSPGSFWIQQLRPMRSELKFGFLFLGDICLKFGFLFEI